MKKYLYYLGAIGVILVAGCKTDTASLPAINAIPKVHIIEKEQTDYWLHRSVQVLKDTVPGYTFQEILQPSLQNKFQVFPDYPAPIEDYQYYWGKIQLENRLTDADQFAEWVLYFTDRWTNLDVFIEEEEGTWRQERNGAFTPDRMKSFVPTARGNLVKFILPPREVVTIYFRGISERTAIFPSFYIHLQHIKTFYDDLLETKVGNAIFIGFLLMMFFYNLTLYFFGRDRSFIFYSGYLIMVVVYASFSSEDLADWFGWFPNHPANLRFMKLSLYLSMMCYMAFIRSFLNLKDLLPKWDTIFKIFIYLGFPLMILDIIVLLLTNFSYVIEDRIVVPYIILMLIICCWLLYPLYKTKDKKGYFIIAGITALCLGAVITVVSRVWVPPFTIFYLKAGTAVEVLIFSVGLAYSQREQKQARQQAEFKLKESHLIQEKKQLEADRLKELNEFKARFYTNITHEFRTPLTVIMGMADNIKKQKKEKQLIQRNSQNLLRQVNQLLDLSKLESGTMALRKGHQDIIFYLHYLTESFYSTAAQKNIRLFFNSEEKAVMMDYDEEKIQQIVYNLLSNALKFTKSGGQVIFHASKKEKGGRPILKLKIKDTGIGISPEDINSIFDRFYQVDYAERNRQASTGIGLALTKELVELMQGQIEVQSSLGEGTEFILYLPIEATVEATAGVLAVEQDEVEKEEMSALLIQDVVHAQGQQDEVSDETEAPSVSPLPELLIIEDNRDIITYVKTILKHKYEIHTTENGILGIEKALQIIPDIIISDVMMPERDGYEVCETLKRDERTSHIPIILLTAKTTQADKVAGLKYGADAYLVKPFDKAELLIRLEKLVAMRRQLQERYSNGISNADPSPDLEAIFLEKLRGHIQAHLSDAEFGVDQLAIANRMKQMQLYRKLKALSGQTPSQFIRSYRLQQGLTLLRTKQFTVSEVAYKVGFTSPSYFSRVFHQEFGRSPSDFLK